MISPNCFLIFFCAMWKSNISAVQHRSQKWWGPCNAWSGATFRRPPRTSKKRPLNRDFRPIFKKNPIWCYNYGVILCYMMIYDDIWWCLEWFSPKTGKSQISQEPAIQVLKKNVCPPIIYEGPLQIEQTLRIWKEDDASFLPLSQKNLKIFGTSQSRGKRKKKFHFTTSRL